MERKTDTFTDIVEKCKRGDFNHYYRPEYLDDLPDGPRLVAGKGVGASETQEFIMREFLPKIDRENCTQCGICWVFCPLGVVSEDAEGYFVVEEDFCRACGVCAKECPTQAITMVMIES